MKTKSVKYNFLMNAILTIAYMIFPLITFPYTSRVLLPAGTGKVAFATSVITYFTMFATLGLPTYGIRACAQVRDDKEKLSATVQELLIISSVMTAAVYLVFFASLLFVPKFTGQKTLLIAASIGIMLNSLGVQWFYSAMEQYTYITLASVAFKVIGIIAMFLFVKAPDDYIIYAWITTFASFGSGILNFVYLRKFITFKKQSIYNFKRHLKPILVFFAMSAASSIYLNLDMVMLGFFKSDAAVGYYNAAVRIKTVFVQLVTSLGTVLLPRLSYYYGKGEKKEFYRIVVLSFQFVLVAAGSLMVYFMLFAKESILLLSGAGFLPSVPAMQILMPTTLLIGLSNITGIQILTPIGRENKVLLSIVCGAVLNLGLNLIWIPKYSYSGAAAATLLAELLVLLIQAYVLRDMLKSVWRRLEPLKLLAALLVAAAGTVLLKTCINAGPFPVLLATGVAFYVLFACMLRLTRETFFMYAKDIIWAKLFGKRGNSSS